MRAFEALPPQMQTDALRPYWEALRHRGAELAVKRLADIVLSLLLLLLSLPVQLLLMLVIVLEDPGEPLYRQRRVTRYCREFTIYKLRTMRRTPEHPGIAVTLEEDARILRCGRLLRRLRLDELPQLYNVLRGDMSLVGTRPEVPEFVRCYSPEMYATLLLPAGIASRAAIAYAGEAALLRDVPDPADYYVRSILPKKLPLDYDRVQDFRLREENAILRDSVLRVLGRRGAMLLNALFLLLGGALAVAGFLWGNPALVLGGCLLLWADNLLWCFGKEGKLLYFGIFMLTMFLFLLGRPTIDWLRGDVIGRGRITEPESFLIIALGLLALRLGAAATQWLPPRPMRHGWTPGIREELRLVSAMVLLAACLCRAMTSMEAMRYMIGRNYEEYYFFTSSLPAPLWILARMAPVALCLCLSTLPKKRLAFTLLLCNVLSYAPQLLFGARADFSLTLLFALVYYLLRHFSAPQEGWFGKWEKRLLVLGVPVLIVGLAMLNYWRDAHNTMASSSLLTDFIYKQGVTSQMLSDTVHYKTVLRMECPCYSVGRIVDYWMHGRVAQQFFGAAALPVGNSLQMVTQGHELCHTISFFSFGARYFQGHGAGSCYLAELYCDLGWVGVAAGSALLGWFLGRVQPLASRPDALGAFWLFCLMNVFFLPRDTFCLPIYGLLTLPSMAALMGIAALTAMLHWLRRKKQIV